MQIEQFTCQKYTNIQKAPCSRDCIRTTTVTNLTTVCHELKLKYTFTEDYI